MVDRLLQRIDPGEGRQQGGMHVDHAVPKSADELRREQLHIAGEHHQVRSPLMDPVA
jgi:hypothetical protein